jgi:hypothetical protein
MSQAAVGGFILPMPLVPAAGIQPESTVCRISDHPANPTGNNAPSLNHALAPLLIFISPVTAGEPIDIEARR